MTRSSRTLHPFLLTATAVLAAGGLAACSSSAGTATSPSAGKGSVTIGYSPPNQSAQLLIDLGHGLQGYASSKGSTVLVADPGNNPATQVQQLTNWIQLGKVQAIWAIALNAESLKPVFAKAKAKGVVVLVNGTPSDYGMTGPEAGVSFSIVDYSAYGKAVGTSLGQCANERLGGKAQAILLPNPDGTVGTKDFEAGVRSALAQTSPGSKIVVTTSNQNDRLKSQQGALADLQANSSINAAIGGNDEGALGAMGAFTQAGKQPASSCLIGSGGNDESLAAVKSGKLFSVTALQFEADLKQNVDQMMKMAADPATVGIQLQTPITTVTK